MNHVSNDKIERRNKCAFHVTKVCLKDVNFGGREREQNLEDLVFLVLTKNPHID